MKKLVKFKCCDSEHIFTKLREFKLCNCGKSGYDSGDGYYIRTIGKFDDLEIINLEKEDSQKLYECQECGEFDECAWECPYCGSDDMREAE